MGEVSQTSGHVFISYVREDTSEVDGLQRALEATGVRVWRDTTHLWPGEDWRARIRNAITDNALVFIACFSRRSVARVRSYQNEELNLAIEQLRLRRPDVPWLIPVRFEDCPIPDHDIGGGRTLTSIQRADLFGNRRGEAEERLIAAVLRILRRPDSIVGTRPALTLVEQRTKDARDLWADDQTGIAHRMSALIRGHLMEPPQPDNLHIVPLDHSEDKAISAARAVHPLEKDEALIAVWQLERPRPFGSETSSLVFTSHGIRIFDRGRGFWLPIPQRRISIPYSEFDKYAFAYYKGRASVPAGGSYGLFREIDTHTVSIAGPVEWDTKGGDHVKYIVDDLNYIKKMAVGL
jgi:TIR domain